jgi:hypothetical protein
VAQYGEEVSAAGVANLMDVPFVEVPVFGGSRVVQEVVHAPASVESKVRAGPTNRSGYTIAGEPIDTEKELYALILEGDTTAFLGEPAQGRKIFKIGLSISPKTRLAAFQKAMPKGAFEWRLFRSTRSDQDAPYPSFEAALAGEDAMKDMLGQHGNWLGGEFYAATERKFFEAWEHGRDAASGYSSEIVETSI